MGYGGERSVAPIGAGGQRPPLSPLSPEGRGGLGGGGAFLYIMENSFEIYKKIEKTLDKPFEL